jgi:hypothetical protein
MRPTPETDHRDLALGAFSELLKAPGYSPIVDQPIKAAKAVPPGLKWCGVGGGRDGFLLSVFEQLQ